MMEYYFHLSSDDFKRVGFRENNKPYDFIIDLKDVITLPDDKYECALINFNVARTRGKSDNIALIFCDLVKVSYVREQYLPILKQVDLRKREPLNREYVMMDVNQFNKIRIYLRGHFMESGSFGLTRFDCTLHIRPRKT